MAAVAGTAVSSFSQKRSADSMLFATVRTTGRQPRTVSASGQSLDSPVGSVGATKPLLLVLLWLRKASLTVPGNLPGKASTWHGQTHSRSSQDGNDRSLLWQDQETIGQDTGSGNLQVLSSHSAQIQTTSDSVRFENERWHKCNSEREWNSGAICSQNQSFPLTNQVNLAKWPEPQIEVNLVHLSPQS